jgi:hypothetical protein
MVTVESREESHVRTTRSWFLDQGEIQIGDALRPFGREVRLPEPTWSFPRYLEHAGGPRVGDREVRVDNLGERRKRSGPERRPIADPGFIRS